MGAGLVLALTGPLCLAGCADVIVGAATTTGLAVVEERTVDDAVKDLTIQAELNHLFFQDDLALYNDVSLSVVEGRVLLKGSVPTYDDRVRAGWIARQGTRVQEVINELQVTGEGGILDYAKDRWISFLLGAKLLVDLDILSVNYDVETVNGTVYLLGIAQDENELEQVKQHARSVDGVERVVSHVIMKDDPRRPPQPDDG
ncbi:MAG: BON domain-containing protein [Rhodospirillaceae bacterium]|nr:BON domain-containing protein [Rhodospirillaceae bacterium]